MAAHLAYYEVLGLDSPPADRKAVKRAYSKMLKVTRPEDDPDGFMRLRDAHDIALNVIAREAENAAWQAQQMTYEVPAAEPVSDPAATKTAETHLTYQDTIPEEAPASDTSYAIGPTPSFDAPVNIPEPPKQKAPPLMALLDAMLDDPKNYNDRENWNNLFRKARQLDIDDYVDFEHLLLEKILHFHGYYEENNPLHDTPEKLYQKLTPSITASLFKTMSWDQVNKQGYHRGYQIEWLQRRMKLRKRTPDAVPIPQVNSDGSSTGKIWAFLIGIFLIAKLIQLMANA